MDILLKKKKKRKRRVSLETAKPALEDFLKDTEWLIRKCGVCDTQAIESFNSIKAKICPKGFAFQKAFRIRCQLASKYLKVTKTV